MRIDEQPRTRWPDPATFRHRRPDLRLGSSAHRLDRSGGVGADRLAVQHTVRTGTAEYTLLLNAPAWLGRRGVGEALRDAVAELRAIDLTYGPNRPESLVSRLRRGEISPESYAPLADLVDRCAAMRAATDGWFDAWAVPGGFDPGGLLGGWAVERAAARLRANGVYDYAVVTGADLVVRGHAPHGGPWRVAVHHPVERDRPPLVLEMTAGAVGTSGVTGRQGHVIDPHTGEPADQLVAATVVGPDLAVADAYATALYAAGPTGLAWFRGRSEYRALFAHRR
ncbi:FAD:protein FMN transferase [Micromonospora globbae]|jgi:thiamine biosynthesis lipoprotein|uniref:FAD:protein FMN transferase n=1 Tax=Micromonospora globbae TaxID=1894969 RepID=A0A420F2I9_9ACTN|nr:FAD:protein FMN transferase [Micromonospora globbae]RKF27226.1 FAD:protein FMN transferase [Micromonospora globbae]WTF87558.1 FAD:protein FMN transferase [Micromonospora globbae]